MEEYLRKIQPFSSLNMSFSECSDTSASLEITLEGNRNDKNTMFAGSIYSVLVLCGWTLAKHVCDKRIPGNDVVIKESRVSFMRPVVSTAVARAFLVEKPEAKGDSRLSLNIKVELYDETDKCSELTGNYIGRKKSP